MSFRVSPDAKEALDGLGQSIAANAELLRHLCHLVERIGPRLELIDKIGPRLELIDKIAQQAQLLEQLGPRLELIDKIAQQAQLLEQLGPRLELIDDLHNRLSDIIDLSHAAHAVVQRLNDIQTVSEAASVILSKYMEQNHLVSESVRIDVETIQALVTSLQVQLNRLQESSANTAS